MYRKGIMLLLSMLLLAGCWDERLYKNASVVTLVGVDGYVGHTRDIMPIRIQQLSKMK